MVTRPFSLSIGWGERYLKTGYAARPAAAAPMPPRQSARNFLLLPISIWSPQVVGQSPCAITVCKGHQGGRGATQGLLAALIACRALMSVIKYHVNRQSQGFHGAPVLFACVDRSFKLIFRTVLSLSMGGSHALQRTG